jgi:hypothetical protein
VPNPARADLPGRDANRAAHSRPETKPARPEFAGRALPVLSSAKRRQRGGMSPAMSVVGSVKGSIKGSVLGWSPHPRSNRHVTGPQRAPTGRRTQGGRWS